MAKFDTVQKRIGILVSLIGITVVLSNINYRVVRGQDFYQIISALTVTFLFLTTTPFIVSIFVESRLLKILQITVFFLTGGLNILSNNYQEFYGPAMFLTGWLLMRHYGFLETYPKTKNTIIMMMVIGFSQVSAIINHPEHGGAYAGLVTLAFSLFLIIIILIIWRDMVRQQELLKQENTALKMDYGQISEQLADIEKSQKPYDLKSVGISPAEERVIRILSIYKASNREIAERLNIAESTVKLHLYNIYNKIGVDNRFAIIDLCKYNFTKEKTNL